MTLIQTIAISFVNLKNARKRFSPPPLVLLLICLASPSSVHSHKKAQDRPSARVKFPFQRTAGLDLCMSSWAYSHFDRMYLPSRRRMSLCPLQRLDSSLRLQQVHATSSEQALYSNALQKCTNLKKRKTVLFLVCFSSRSPFAPLISERTHSHTRLSATFAGILNLIQAPPSTSTTSSSTEVRSIVFTPACSTEKIFPPQAVASPTKKENRKLLKPSKRKKKGKLH